MLDVIIVNYNMKELLKESLNSIFKSDFKDFDVMVVDNASSDNSVEMIKKFKVKLIVNKENLGLAKALNQAIRQSNSKYIQIMHPDVLVSEDTFSKMIDFMEKNKDVAVLGCKVKHPDGKIFPSCHRFPRPSAFVLNILPIPRFIAQKFNIYGLFMRNMDFNKLQEVDIIASAFLLLRRNDFLFDENFTNWTLEWDLCYRIKKKYRIMYFPYTKVIHYESYVPKDKLKFSKEIEYKFKKGYIVADKVQKMLFLFYKKHYSWFDYHIFKFLSIINLLLKSFLKSFTIYKEDSKDRIYNYFKTIKVCLEDGYNKK